MVAGAFTAGLVAAQQALLAGAVLAAVATAALAVWLRSREERTVTSLARQPMQGCPDPCDPAIGLARLRFAQGEIGREDLRRVIEAQSRTWQA